METHSLCFFNGTIFLFLGGLEPSCCSELLKWLSTDGPARVVLSRPKNDVKSGTQFFSPTMAIQPEKGGRIAQRRRFSSLFAGKRRFSIK
jgi:hypothetical protein